MADYMEPIKQLADKSYAVYPTVEPDNYFSWISDRKEIYLNALRLYLIEKLGSGLLVSVIIMGHARPLAMWFTIFEAIGFENDPAYQAYLNTWKWKKRIQIEEDVNNDTQRT